MATISINLIVPQGWHELDDAQLRYVYSLIAKEFSADEIKTLALLKWATPKVRGYRGSINDKLSTINAMSKAIHIITARTMLNSGDPVDISVWKANGSILELRNCISLRYNFYGGWRNVKILSSGECRKIRDCCIFRVNDCEVFL